MTGQIYLDGDFHTAKCGLCPYHRWPTIHPAQDGRSGDIFICAHWGWPRWMREDFRPPIGCGGDISRCELPAEDYIKEEIREQIEAAERAKEASDDPNTP